MIIMAWKWYDRHWWGGSEKAVLRLLYVQMRNVILGDHLLPEMWKSFAENAWRYHFGRDPRGDELPDGYEAAQWGPDGSLWANHQTILRAGRSLGPAERLQERTDDQSVRWHREFGRTMIPRNQHLADLMREEYTEWCWTRAFESGQDVPAPEAAAAEAVLDVATGVAPVEAIFTEQNAELLAREAARDFLEGFWGGRIAALVGPRHLDPVRSDTWDDNALALALAASTVDAASLKLPAQTR